jgi:hypothetical protein
MSDRFYTCAPPKGLSAKARAVWLDQIPNILAAYHCTELEVPRLVRYCQATASAREAERLVDRDGLVSENGRSTAAGRALRDSIALAERILRQLTPDAGLGKAPAGVILEELYRLGVLEDEPEGSTDAARGYVAAKMRNLGLEPSLPDAADETIEL